MYFVVLSGEKAGSLSAQAGKLVPIAAAPVYPAAVAADIAASDGTPSYFWDDLQTGTSQLVVSAAQQSLLIYDTLEATALGHLIDECERQSLVMRLWWHSHLHDTFGGLPQATGTAETLRILKNQCMRSPLDLGYLMRPQGAVS
jgi:hypothetical protein